MKFSIPAFSFFWELGLEGAVKKVKEHGFDIVEFGDWREFDLDEMKRVADAYGMQITSFFTTNFNMTAPEIRKEWLDGLKESCAAAKRAGVKMIITQGGPDTGARRDFQRSSIIAAIREARPILEEYGVTLLIEPLNTYVDHPDAFLSKATEGFDIVREAGNPYAKILFDIYHEQVMEGNIIPNITNNLDAIGHLHAAGHPGRIDLNLGELNYNVIFDAIDKSAYKGVCSLEHRSVPGGDVTLETVKKLYCK